LDSIGVQYNSAGLALGRAMNKNEKTLIETMGIEKVSAGLSKKSLLYNSFFKE
jgi:hypothetical protein